MSEAAIRLTAFLSIFAAMAAFELWSPRLERAEMRGALKSRRWVTNLAMVVLSSVLVRLLFPAAAVGAAVWAQMQGFGLFRLVGVDPVLAGLLGFVILDFAVWLEHWASHKVQILWRIHRVHHADTGFDLTTALRFHPVEIVLSMIWKAAIVTVLGVPVVAVLVFEIVLNGMAMFNHANARLPLGLDRLMRLFLVTPDMHRVHHSSIPTETDSNYGFNFPFWDRFFGTYTDQPQLGHDDMEIGLREYRDGSPATLTWSLALPFVGTTGAPADQKKPTGK